MLVNPQTFAQTIKAALAAVRPLGEQFPQYLGKGHFRTGGKRSCALAAVDGELRVLAEGEDRLAWGVVPLEGEPPIGNATLRIDLPLLRSALESLSYEPQVDVALADGRLHIAAPTANLVLPAPEIDAPNLPTLAAAQALPDGALRAAHVLLPYLSRDDTRAVLMHVQFAHSAGQWSVAATDTHRLGVVRLDGPGEAPEAFREVLIPLDVLKSAPTFLGEGAQMYTTSDPAWVALASPRATVLWRKHVGAFPDWQKVLDYEKSPVGHAELPIAATLRALKTADVVGRDDADRVRILDAGDRTTIVAEYRDEQARAEAAVEGATWVGTQREVNLNGAYLAQILRAHRGLGAKTARITLHGALNQVQIEGVEPPAASALSFKSVVMPMQK